MSFVKIAFENLKYLFTEIKVIESALIAAAIWWAFILAMPLDTFESSDAYRAMAEIASEEVWASIFFVVALCMLYSMIFNKYRIRMVSLTISNGLWIFVSAMFAIGNIATTGTGIYFIVACLNAFVVYKVGERHGNERCQR